MSTHMSLTFLPGDKKANKPNGPFTRKSDFALNKSVLPISCTLLGSMGGTTTDKVILLKLSWPRSQGKHKVKTL